MTANFFIVGAAKCGTTSWGQYLSQHEEVCVTSLSEPHHFLEDAPHYRQIKNLNDYEYIFRSRGNFKTYADVSPMYISSALAAQRIYEYNPLAKILILLRKPSRFIYSYHNQMVLNGDQEISSIHEAWLKSELRDSSNAARARDLKLVNYKNIGAFGAQVKCYLDIFPEDSIMVAFMQNWVTSPREFYLEIMRFLGINDDGFNDFSVENSARSYRFQFMAGLLDNAYLKKRAAKVSRIWGLRDLVFTRA